MPPLLLSEKDNSIDITYEGRMASKRGEALVCHESLCLPCADRATSIVNQPGYELHGQSIPRLGYCLPPRLCHYWLPSILVEKMGDHIDVNADERMLIGSKDCN
jgi:hypothetical protein